MINIPSTSNNDIKYISPEYKDNTCAGLHCKNFPTHHLKLVILKRSGLFCSDCKKSLQKEGLVESPIHKILKKEDEN